MVDLWGGWADAARTRPWGRDTLVDVRSTGKGPTALRVDVLAGRGSLDGRRVLSGKAAVRVGEGQGPCRDLVLGDGFVHETEIALGRWLSGANRSYGPDPRAFGHDGAGGSCGLADPDASIALGYVMNRTGSRLADDPRTTALVNAVYAAHGETAGR
ncbi:serine hydrolase [Streptomyces sp. NPDC088719]|uniref:serine hydrolase n=1 Tax=Streptomyces sp. NPDC088719 TaxID=3365872 RepID=UPI0037F85E3F